MRNNWKSSDSTKQSQVFCKISFWYIKDYGPHETNVAFSQLLLEHLHPA